MTGRRVSVVTGGSSGIGRSLALALAGRGDNVIVVGRDHSRLDATLAALREAGDGRHLALSLNVAEPGDMAAMARLCRSDYGRVDILVASAGIGGADAGGLPKATKDLSLGEWRTVVGVNLHGVFLSNSAVLPLMREQGAGVIVNICSALTPHGLRGRPLAPAYSAAKFAVAEYSRALAAEVAAHGVRVHAVYPGAVETPLIADTLLDAPFGGSMAPESFADTVLGLLDLDEAEVEHAYVMPMPVRLAQADTGTYRDGKVPARGPR